MPDAYSPEDQIYAATMTFEREDGNGDRFFRRDAVCEAVRGNPQAYFYRAMKRDEAFGWLHPNRNAVADPNGHHGFASYRSYSAGYLTRGHKYTYLLEIHAPDFLTNMKAIGFIEGKAEGGDLSWGIGGTSSNAFRGDKGTNKALKTLFGTTFPNTAAPKGGLRGMALPLAPRIFVQSIQTVTVVNLRSEKPG
jgi:hypothetical protein